jgi:hypothetical protein
MENVDGPNRKFDGEQLGLPNLKMVIFFHGELAMS